MSQNILQISRHEHYTILTLNRPEKLNAFTPALHKRLLNTLYELGDDRSCRAVLLTGAGRGFCAGQDLGQRNPATMKSAPDLGESLDKHYNPLIRQIKDLPKPVICAVNGVAAGAGANLALACDIVIAARSARFIQSFSRIGLVPDSGGTWVLPRILGEARAKGLAMTGQPISAQQACDWGLIWQVVEDEELADVSRQLTESLAVGPTYGLGLTKLAIHEASTNTLDQQLDLERDLQRAAGRSLDYREGVAAFLEKRKPEYVGE